MTNTDHTIVLLGKMFCLAFFICSTGGNSINASSTTDVLPSSSPNASLTQMISTYTLSLTASVNSTSSPTSSSLSVTSISTSVTSSSETSPLSSPSLITASLSSTSVNSTSLMSSYQADSSTSGRSTSLISSSLTGSPSSGISSSTVPVISPSSTPFSLLSSLSSISSKTVEYEPVNSTSVMSSSPTSAPPSGTSTSTTSGTSSSPTPSSALSSVSPITTSLLSSLGNSISLISSSPSSSSLSDIPSTSTAPLTSSSPTPVPAFSSLPPIITSVLSAPATLSDLDSSSSSAQAVKSSGLTPSSSSPLPSTRTSSLLTLVQSISLSIHSPSSRLSPSDVSSSFIPMTSSSSSSITPLLSLSSRSNKVTSSAATPRPSPIKTSSTITSSLAQSLSRSQISLSSSPSPSPSSPPSLSPSSPPSLSPSSPPSRSTSQMHGSSLISPMETKTPYPSVPSFSPTMSSSSPKLSMPIFTSSAIILATSISINVEDPLKVYIVTAIIDRKWDENYALPLTNEFKALKKEIEESLKEAFKDTPGFLNVKIIAFRKGSVKFDFKVFFKESSDINEDSLVKKIENSKSETLKGIKVDKVERAGAEKPKKETKKTLELWVIVAIVAGGIVIIYTAVLIFLLIKMKRLKRQRYVSMFKSSSTHIGNEDLSSFNMQPLHAQYPNMEASSVFTWTEEEQKQDGNHELQTFSASNGNDNKELGLDNKDEYTSSRESHDNEAMVFSDSEKTNQDQEQKGQDAQPITSVVENAVEEDHDCVSPFY